MVYSVSQLLKQISIYVLANCYNLLQRSITPIIAAPLLSNRLYYPELDVFRAGSILLVIISHWLPMLHLPIDLGSIGVTSFFVLSGFLITSILRRFHKKSPVERKKYQFAYAFFVRRILRLLPAYYFALLLAWLPKLSYMREAWPWFALHGANIFLFRQQHWGEGTGHFWSLAVEEQFYLFWPVLILLLPPRWLGPMFGVLVGAGPVIRWWLWQHTGTSFSLILTPACLDLFAVGAGLSLLVDHTHLPARVWFWVGVISSGSYWLLATTGPAVWFLAVGPSCLAVSSAAAIAIALSTRSTKAKWALRLPLFIAIGRLSYGLYLYHLFMPIILHRLLHHTGNLFAQGRYYAAFMALETTNLGLLIMALLLVVLTLISWEFIEKPIRSLNRFFPY